jgi:hypothetical protein
MVPQRPHACSLDDCIIALMIKVPGHEVVFIVVLMWGSWVNVNGCEVQMGAALCIIHASVTFISPQRSDSGPRAVGSRYQQIRRGPEVSGRCLLGVDHDSVGHPSTCRLSHLTSPWVRLGPPRVPLGPPSVRTSSRENWASSRENWQCVSPVFCPRRMFL